MEQLAIGSKLYLALQACKSWTWSWWTYGTTEAAPRLTILSPMQTVIMYWPGRPHTSCKQSFIDKADGYAYTPALQLHKSAEHTMCLKFGCISWLTPSSWVDWLRLTAIHHLLALIGTDMLAGTSTVAQSTVGLQDVFKLLRSEGHARCVPARCAILTADTCVQHASSWWQLGLQWCLTSGSWQLRWCASFELALLPCQPWLDWQVAIFDAVAQLHIAAVTTPQEADAQTRTGMQLMMRCLTCLDFRYWICVIALSLSPCERVVFVTVQWCIYYTVFNICLCMT